MLNFESEDDGDDDPKEIETINRRVRPEEAAASILKIREKKNSV